MEGRGAQVLLALNGWEAPAQPRPARPARPARPVSSRLVLPCPALACPAPTNPALHRHALPFCPAALPLTGAAIFIFSHFLLINCKR